MIEKIIELVSKAFFREQYLKGFVAERHDEINDRMLREMFTPRKWKVSIFTNMGRTFFTPTIRKCGIM